VIEPHALQQLDRTYVLWRGRKLSYFSGCDYFRVSAHPKVHQALKDGLSRFGLNVAASRLTTGNHVLYGRLEARLRSFFKVGSALLVSTGYVSNLAVAQALSGQFSHALIDEAAHPSLQDAAKLLECPVLEFAHGSVANLSSAIERCGPSAKLIVLTDGCFARDGSVPPLKAYKEKLPEDALLLVDDAHGAGVLGAHGRGSLEQTKTGRGRVIQTVTLSKGFGTYGGVILSSKAIRQRILDHSRLFIGSTPLPLPLANAGLTAVALLAADRSFRGRLTANMDQVYESLTQAGVCIPRHPGPIVSLQTSNPRNSAKLTRVLLAHRIFPPFLRYPGGPPAGYFRFVISSEHTRVQLRNLVSALTACSNLISPLTTS
jgi:7-keto-8-aminopelargonate synthetase-like enzyme